MSEAAIFHRRNGDGRIPWIPIAERILLWAAVLGAIGHGAIKYARLVDTVARAEATERRVADVEKLQSISDVRSDERFRAVIERLDRIERKIDRRFQ